MAGCGSAPAGDPAPPPPVLVTPSEQADLEASLLAALGENRERRCPRPVLGDRGLLGRPDPLIVALVEPEGALARCAEAVLREEPRWRQALFAPGPEGGALPRLRARASMPADGAPWAAPADCAALPEAIGRAVRFTSACSPYLPGRRRLPKLGALVGLLQGVVLVAQGRRRLDPAGAAFLLLESLRLQQDLCRGGVPWIWPFVLREPLRLTVALLREVLAADRLEARDLDALGKALDVLGATEPTPGSYLRGEQLTVELGSFLVPLMHPGWVPPGGEPTPGFDPGAGIPHRALGSPRQDLLLAWLAHRQRSERWLGQCAPGTAPFRCLEALEASHLEVRVRVGHLEERWKALGERLREALAADRSRGHDSAKARQAVIEWLVALGPTSTADHLRRAAERPFWLAALRVHVAVLGAQAGSGEPMTPGQLLRLPAAKVDPFWREPLAVQGEPGAVLVRPSRALAPAGEPPLVYLMSWKVPRAPGRRPPSRP